VHFKPKLVHLVKINWLILVRKQNQWSSNYYFLFIKKHCMNISFIKFLISFIFTNKLFGYQWGDRPWPDPPLL